MLKGRARPKSAILTWPSNIEPTALVDQDVLRLEVAVHDALRVAVGHAREDLVEDRLDHHRLKELFLLERLEVRLQVLLVEVEHEVQLLLVRDHVAQPHDVRVAQLGEQRDLAQRGRRDAFVLVLLSREYVEYHLLQRDLFVRLQVQREVHHSVGAFPDAVELLVPRRHFVLLSERVRLYHPQVYNSGSRHRYLRRQKAKIWIRRGLIPGPSACEADVIPLHHKPIWYCKLRCQTTA